MSAEERHQDIASLASQTTRATLALAPHLAVAYADRDYEELEMENYAQYLDSVGVSKSQDSKLRRAYAVFGQTWGSCERNPEVTVERLYLAARIKDAEGLDVYDAFSLAASTPSHELVARLKGEPADPKPVHECPLCHTEHVIGRSK